MNRMVYKLGPSHRRLHNLAHVELNAVDLAMDTLARFAHLRLPAQFYLDFLHIADDESRHFGESATVTACLS